MALSPLGKCFRLCREMPYRARAAAGRKTSMRSPWWRSELNKILTITVDGKRKTKNLASVVGYDDYIIQLSFHSVFTVNHHQITILTSLNKCHTKVLQVFIPLHLTDICVLHVC